MHAQYTTNNDIQISSIYIGVGKRCIKIKKWQIFANKVAYSCYPFTTSVSCFPTTTSYLPCSHISSSSLPAFTSTGKLKNGFQSLFSSYFSLGILGAPSQNCCIMSMSKHNANSIEVRRKLLCTSDNWETRHVNQQI